MNQSSLASRTVNHLNPFYVNNKYLLGRNLAGWNLPDNWRVFTPIKHNRENPTDIKVVNTVKVVVAPLSGLLSLHLV